MRRARYSRWAAVILTILCQQSIAEPQRITPSSTRTSTTQTAPITTIPVVATTHTIFVPETDGFEPAVTTAKIGDFAEWRFDPGKHWVIRGAFDYPCVPYEYFGVGRKGFSSGNRSVKKETDDDDKERVFRVKINDSLPIWYYSGQPEACFKDRIMGVINPIANRNLSDWKRMAEKVDFQLRPGEPWPIDEDKPSSTDSNAPTQTTESPDEDKTDDASPGGSDGGDKDKASLGPGAIAGVTVGGVVMLAILGILIFYCGRRGGLKVGFARSETASEIHNEVGRYGSYQPQPGFHTPARPPRTPEMEDWSSPATFQSEAWRHTSPSLCSYHQRFPNSSPSNSSSYGCSPRGSPQQQMGLGVNLGCNACCATWNARRLSRFQEMYVDNVPVELPTSSDPGNSPLPRYPSYQERRQFSWDKADDDPLLKLDRI